METDLSQTVYIKWMQLRSNEAEIVMKNGKIITGHIAGFFKGDPELHEPYIIGWHLIQAGDCLTGRDGFGFTAGVIIFQHDIASIKLSDNSFFQFKYT